jgi:heavy metal sensor kinase
MRRPSWLALRSLRLRLTAWYVLLLSLTLVVFSGCLYLRMEQSLLAQVDTGLQVAASQALANLDEENSRLTFQTTERSQSVARRLSQAGFVVRLVDPNGTVQDGFGNMASLPAAAPATPGYATLSGRESRWRTYSQPIVGPDGRVLGWLQAAQSLASLQETLQHLRRQALLGVPLVALVTGLGGLFLADRALRPIDSITRTAQAISGSDLSRRIGRPGPPDEVGRLAATFDSMLDRLQAAFGRERRFTADASHELRTPLAALKGCIEVTLSRQRTVEEYQATLHDLEREADRLIRLCSDLLLLARLDQGRLPRPVEILDLGDLLGATVEQVRPLAEARGLALVERLPEGLLIRGDMDHLIRLFLNLLDNAIKHTPRGGQVSVGAERLAGEVRVTISDTGPGIAAEHLPHLFERFYRVEAARSRDSGGAGLGLAMAYEIAAWHGGRLDVASEVGAGTTFTVRLPLRTPAAALASRAR